jgi:hypothetical protein
MRKNVSSQSIGIGMTSVLSGTDYTNSGAVLVYLTRDAAAIALGAVNSGICIPLSFGAHYYIAAQSETNFNHILFTFVASGAISRHINVYTERVGVPTGADLATDIGSIQVGVNSLYARVGAPVGASLAVDVKSIQTQVDSIYGRIGENGINITSATVAVAGTTVTDIASAALARFFDRDSGVLYSAAVSGSVVKEIGYTAINSSVQANSIQIGVNSLYARVGAPVGASLAVDVKSVQTQVDSIYGRIGENGINITSASVSVAGATVTDIASAALALFFNRDSGVLYSAAVSGSVVKEIGYTAINSSVQANSIQIGVNSLYARVGAPVGASLSVDVSSVQAGVSSLQPLTVSVGSVQTGVSSLVTQTGSNMIAISSVQIGVNSLYARVGAPVGADIATDIKSVQSGVNSTMARIGESGINITSASVSVGGATVTDIASSALALFFTRDSGKFYTDAVSGSVVKETAYTAINSSVQANSIQIGVNSLYARVGAPIGASLSVDVSSVQIQVNSIYSQTNKLTFGGANRLLSDMTAVNSDATAASNLANGALGLVVSTCAAGSTTTSIVTNLTEATNGHYNGRVITFLTGALADQSTNITAYDGATKTLTVTALTEAPADTDKFVIS